MPRSKENPRQFTVAGAEDDDDFGVLGALRVALLLMVRSKYQVLRKRVLCQENVCVPWCERSSPKIAESRVYNTSKCDFAPPLEKLQTWVIYAGTKCKYEVAFMKHD